jgi:hypothetical protein
MLLLYNFVLFVVTLCLRHIHTRVKSADTSRTKMVILARTSSKSHSHYAAFIQLLCMYYLELRSLRKPSYQADHYLGYTVVCRPMSFSLSALLFVNSISLAISQSGLYTYFIRLRPVTLPEDMRRILRAAVDDDIHEIVCSDSITVPDFADCD